MPPALRFAPSPNGRLHLGHAYSAWLNAELARRLGGRFLVRLEDIDITRCTQQLARHCLDDLAWLGLEWEEPVRVQSEHWDEYEQALRTLKKRQLVYPCFCSRSQIAAASTAKDPDGAPIYPGTCQGLSTKDVASRRSISTPHSWRLDIDKALAETGSLTYQRFTLPDFSQETVAASPERWGDVVIARKEVPTSYHLSVVVDDALQEITHVVRGKDLEAATDVHVLLQNLLGLPAPLYHHHGLLTDTMGSKLAKRKGSETLADLRAQGTSPQEIRALLAGQLPD